MSKKGKKDLRRAISRRGLLLAGGQLALTGLLAGRLYQLQVAQSSRYKGLSEFYMFLCLHYSVLELPLLDCKSYYLF